MRRAASAQAGGRWAGGPSGEETGKGALHHARRHHVAPFEFQVLHIVSRPLELGNEPAAAVVDGQHLVADAVGDEDPRRADRKSTRLNSSHANISYAVFCLKKKKHNSYNQ